MSENTSDILAQIHSIPSLIDSEFDTLVQRVDSLFPRKEWARFSNIILTGCGDSYMACLAAELAFRQFAELRIHAYPAMTAGRYAAPFCEPSTLVFAVSVSGTAARPQEALLNYEHYGATTVAMTSNEDSPLASCARYTLNCAIPSFEPPPSVRSSVRSYAVSLTMLWLLAIRAGQARGILSQERAHLLQDELRATADEIDKTISKSSDVARELAEEYWSKRSFVFVADGPNYATAMFGAAKLIENTGHHAMAQDTEEWAHLQYLTIMDRSMPTVVISPGYRGHHRVAEVVEPMLRTGHPVLAVVPASDDVVAPLATRAMFVTGNTREAFTPQVYAIPCELFSAYLIDVTGTTPYRRPFEGENAVFKEGSTTVDSRIDVPVAP